MKVTLKSKLKSIETEVEIDGGKLMEAIFVTCVMVQMGYPTGVVEVRSQMPHTVAKEWEDSYGK